MNPLKKANVRYFNNDRTYYGSERNMHNMTHLQRSCIDIFKNEMIIMLNDTWANKKTAQDMDIGSAMHQKLHQMHSNRLVLVPLKSFDPVRRVIVPLLFTLILATCGVVASPPIALAAIDIPLPLLGPSIGAL